jgi:uncharacterized protein YcbK (DUF882 family)
MLLTRIRLKKEVRLKVWLFLIFITCVGILVLPKTNRSALVSFFSVKCRITNQKVFSKNLNDKIVEYLIRSKMNGISICKDKEEIDKRISEKKLFNVRSCKQYLIDRMTNSYPCLTADSKALLDEIGKRFYEKTANDGLKGSKFIVTSMTRTSEKIKVIKRTNVNVSDKSPHLKGNAFDISYVRFSFRKLFVRECDKWYLKEALAEVIWQLREEKKCWATYEKRQGCFHVVSR